jgi:glucosamine--fructose-6-phosphate aminotransferase (isomerizing)
VIGVGIGENFISSDQLALLPVTNRFVYLEEGDIARLTRTSIEVLRKVKLFNVQ